MTLGERLAWARTNAGLSRHQAARLLAVTPGTIVYAEADRIAVSARHLAKAAEVYGVKSDWLTSGEEPEILPEFVGKIDMMPGYTLAPDELHDLRLMLWRMQ